MSTAQQEPRYEVFISYRRGVGNELALLLQRELQRHNIPAFLDRDLRRGIFDETLLRRIAESPTFLIILTPNALDRCSVEEDWLRKEIVQAIACQRNIIPMQVDSFKFTSDLVRSLDPAIRDLSRYQTVVYSHDYFESTIERIVKIVEEDRAERKAVPKNDEKRERTSQRAEMLKKPSGKLEAVPSEVSMLADEEGLSPKNANRPVTQWNQHQENDPERNRVAVLKQNPEENITGMRQGLRRQLWALGIMVAVTVFLVIAVSLWLKGRQSREQAKPGAVAGHSITVTPAAGQSTEPVIGSDLTSHPSNEKANPQPSSEKQISPLVLTTPTPAPTKAPVKHSSASAVLAKAQRYLQGRGVRQNCETGLLYLKAATQQNDPNAAIQMAALFAGGHCVQKDLVKAYQWFATAHNQEPDNQWIAKNMNQLWGQMTPQQRRQFQ